jgi:M6 family metalloprotease-like protein
MTIEICSPRIFSRAIFVGVALFASTFVLAHNPDANSTDPVAAAQWKPGAPQVQLEGQIEIVHQDFPDGHGKFIYTLKQSNGSRVPLHFVKNPPTYFLTGDHVTAKGQQSSSGLILYSGGNVKNSGGGGSTGGGTSSSIPVPNTFGTQSVLVILVDFQDDAVQPYTVADAQNAFFSSSNGFFIENSYQQTTLTGSVVGWYTIPDSVTACNISQIATDAKSAATAAGVNLSNYTRYVYAFPYNSACGWAGSSDVGGNPSESWINGTMGPGGTTLSIHVIDHELGHAFGLWHSHLLSCGTSAVICSNGTSLEYGDPVDVMGTPQDATPHYNAFQKERLGWLNYGSSPSIQTVTSSGTYTIYPYELAGSGPNALKILQSTNSTTGAKTSYYLESRQAIGLDAFLTTWPYGSTQNETTGVLFHLGTDGDGNSSELLDMTPATQPENNYFDSALTVGQSFADSSAGVTFTPTSVTSTSATIQITMNGGGATCTATNPSVGISPSQSQYVTSGTPVTFTVTMTDNDTPSCAPATFNVAGMLPGGWIGTLSATSLSLSPGKSGSSTLTVTSPTGTADGSYNIVASATNASSSSYGASATAAYVINSAPLTVSMTTNQSNYLPGQTVGIYVTMLYGASPDVDASVTITVTSPNGKNTTLSGSTGSSGMALLSYKLGKNAPAGTYQAWYGTTVTGAASIMGASTSFIVQ